MTLLARVRRGRHCNVTQPILTSASVKRPPPRPRGETPAAWTRVGEEEGA